MIFWKHFKLDVLLIAIYIRSNCNNILQRGKTMGFVSDNLKMLSDISAIIAMEFGQNCEVVLHDLTLPYNKTIVAIWNGHVTGRKVGDGGTDAGLKILKGTVSPKDQCYINKLPNGKILRSSIKYFRDEYGKVTGSLCINYDISSMISIANDLRELTTAPSTETPEFFLGNIDDLLDQMMSSAISATEKNIDELNKDDKIQIVKDLDSRGFFLVKKSTEKLAAYLGLSRYSIYNYLKEDNEPVVETMN